MMSVVGNVPIETSPPAPRLRSRRFRWVVLAMVAGTFTVGFTAKTIRGEIELPSSGHRRPPQPDGMVFRVEAREVAHPFDRIEVHPVDRGGPAIAVFEPAVTGHVASLSIYSYRDGRRIEALSGDEAIRAEATIEAAASMRTNVPFDFDGDGVADTIEEFADRSGWGSTVRIVSGRDGRALFVDEDPVEYEGHDRMRMLGDLDGDGYAEIALVHPRMDRSRYDLELWDALFGAKSWVTVISGSHIKR